MQTRDLKTHLSQASEWDGDDVGKFHQNKMSIRENELKSKMRTSTLASHSIIVS